MTEKRIFERGMLDGLEMHIRLSDWLGFKLVGKFGRGGW